jgi:hypothetical protein
MDFELVGSCVFLNRCAPKKYEHSSVIHKSLLGFWSTPPQRPCASGSHFGSRYELIWRTGNKPAVRSHIPRKLHIPNRVTRNKRISSNDMRR